MQSITFDAADFPLHGRQLIEASAGTGKTYSITNLYLRLLLGVDCSALTIDQILLVTFTIAATDELKGRVRQRIEDMLSAVRDGHSDDPFLLKLLIQVDSAEATRQLTIALYDMDQASIHTIHGFCARLLRDMAFESGNLFEIDVEVDASPFVMDAASDYFRTVMGDEALARELGPALLQTWRNPMILAQELRSYIYHPNAVLYPVWTDPSKSREAYHEAWQLTQQHWPEIDLGNHLLDSGMIKNRKPVSAVRLAELNDFLLHGGEMPKELDVWSRKSLERNLRKGCQLIPHPLLDALDLLIQVAQDYHNKMRVHLTYEALRYVRNRIDLYKNQTNQMTLDDLLTRVAAGMQGDAGTALRRSLRQQYRAILVDEFQDTDDLQYQIFHSIQAELTIYVGDPKQAIYFFRGADVHTYLKARQQSDNLFELTTNWRSDSAMVAAINQLFSRPDCFFNDKDIPYTQNQASPQSDQQQIRDSGEPVAPVSFLHVSDSSGKATKNQVRDHLVEAAADEASRLLHTGSDITLGDNPLTAGQIAFLVRDRHEARATRDALARRNIKSVYVTLDSVFETETARDLLFVLLAVLEPGNDAVLKAALSVPLLKGSAEEIHELNLDLMKHQAILLEFMDYHDIWARHGIAAMLEDMTHRRKLAARWLPFPEGERRITDLRHLGELLQHRSVTAPGLHRLVKWLSREINQAESVAAEGRQLRLESDRQLVQIVTMHGAKGLEYDVVFIPMMFFQGRDRNEPPAMYHQHDQTRVDLTPDEAAMQQVTRERLAEETRLLYVAITRSRHKCYLGVGCYRQWEKSAGARLLGLANCNNDEDVSINLTLEYARPLFDYSAITSTRLLKIVSTTPVTLIEPAVVFPNSSWWRIYSYTGISRQLTRDAEGKSQDRTTNADEDISGFSDDDQIGTRLQEVTANTRHTFQRGPRVGLMLHAVLEDLVPVFEANRAGLTQAESQTALHTRKQGLSPEETQTLTDVLQQQMSRFGLQGLMDDWSEILKSWITDILTTPLLKQTTSSTSLAGLDRSIPEMEFHIPLGDDFNLQRLVALLNQYGYLPTSESDFSVDLEGMMTGMIDLIIESNHRFYIVDYKSNHLGPDQDSYRLETMQDAVNHHQYDLQYLIYLVALHRFLSLKKPDYCYEDDIGGALYLFLRGMDRTRGAGVFHDRPPFSLIEELDSLFKSPTGVDS